MIKVIRIKSIHLRNCRVYFKSFSIKSQNKKNLSRIPTTLTKRFSMKLLYILSYVREKLNNNIS